MRVYLIVGGEGWRMFARLALLAALALPGASVVAQAPPDVSGRVLQQIQTQEPLRIPMRPGAQVTPKPPAPPPALKPAPTLRVTVTKFVFSGNTLYPNETLQEIVKEFVGKQLDFNELNDVATKVRAYHRERGYFLAQAYLPEQVIKGGVIQIAIIEGRVGVLELVRRPASRLSDTLLSGIIGSHLQEGQLITETGLERPLLLINDLPTAVVASEIRRSDTIGAADLRVNVDQGDNYISGYVDADNEGNRFTGEYRLGLNLNLNNPTGWGDQLSFRGFRTDEQMSYSRLSYLRPVGYYGTRVGASYSRFDYQLTKAEFDPLRANGYGTVISVYGFHPIIRTRNTNLIYQFSYEDKQLTDKIDSQNTFTERSIGLLRNALIGDFRDGLLGGGLNAYTVAYSYGHLGLSPTSAVNGDANTGTGGHNTQGTFQKINIELRRLQKTSENGSLLLALVGQKADRNLAAAEKITIGGPNAVRAYPVSEGVGDEGAIVQVEYRYIWPGFKPLGADFTLSAFADHGQTMINKKPNPTDAQNYRSLDGIGIGASLGRDGNFLAKVMVSWRTDGETAQSDAARGSPMAWFQLIKYF